MRFSLVIGSYNPNKEWLDNALKSAEGLFDEIILVDDGSNEPIQGATIRKKNGGFYTARNAGIEKVTGDIICSLDDDDEFIKEGVIEAKQICEALEADIYSFPIELFGEQNGLAFVYSDIDSILNANQLPSGSWFKKSVWQELGGFKYPKAEDWDFWTRAWKKNKKFIHLNIPVYRHRMRKGSLSYDWTGDKFLEIREEIRKLYVKA
jgi:glycosyltransferase involved in cell wall biosynthesis